MFSDVSRKNILGMEALNVFPIILSTWASESLPNIVAKTRLLSLNDPLKVNRQIEIDPLQLFKSIQLTIRGVMTPVKPGFPR